MYRFLLRLAALASLVLSPLLVLTGCSREPADILGKAYVAPATLNLRGQLAQKNSTVAVLKHGDSVGIVDIRRRFVKVRTDKGVQGWVDSIDLLSTDEMQQIQRERQQALALPPQGFATPYEALNIHIEPSRQSPAFAQIPEGGSAAVLAYRDAAKTTGPAKPPSFLFEKPQAPVRKPKHERQAKISSHLPPKPPAPKLPDNWQALSYGYVDPAARSTAETPAGAQKADDAKKPVVMEVWALIRTKNNQVGWVLARNLMMGIPDEVAQYAEGKRITSYFDLGAVQDEEKGVKHNWLWTTMSTTEPYDFNSWRVFLWNRRRHRYETSYRQRDVEGYFPVHVDGPAFQLITRDDDGKMRRRSYLFDGTRVHLTGTEAYNPQPKTENKTNGIDVQQLASKLPHTGWIARQWAALKRKLAGGS
ncbi:MAG: SH3 domain-containing protein [Acidobacteriaceae bacterium]|nr:SH3 domain-containing protein [Acidobacteriaceae bacterium]